MLSFMKEEESNQASAAASNKKQQSFTQGQTDSGSGADDFLVPAASTKKAKYSTYVLIAIFVIGLASLFVMIKKSTPSQAQAALSEQDMKVESAIAKLVGSKTQLNTRMEEVVRKIDQLSKIEQVGVNELKRNPFKLQSFSSGSLIDINSLKGKLGSDFSLKLWGVMNRDGEKCCMINDKLLKVNDTFDGYTVKRIGEGFVELASEKGSIILRISE